MKRISVVWVIILLILSVSAVAIAGTPKKGTIDLTGLWKFNIDPGNKGFANGWEKPGFNDSAWDSITVPGDWKSQAIMKPGTEIATYTGYGWYRRTAVIPMEWKGKKLFLNVGQIFDIDWTYVNGTLVGRTVDGGKGLHRSYALPDSVVKYGEPNTIVIRILNTDPQGGMQDRPVSITTDKPNTPTAPLSTYESSAPSGEDAVRIGSTLYVGKDQTTGEATAIGGDVIVEGHVTGDAVSVGGTIRVPPWRGNRWRCNSPARKH